MPFFATGRRNWPQPLRFPSTPRWHSSLTPASRALLHPAVVLGQSILSDSFVATLILHADLSAPSTAHAIGEFRTRVELTQPTTGLLWVRYRDPDPGQAVANANAVAKVLAGWAPSTTSAPPPAAPASAAAPQPAPAAEPSLAAPWGNCRLSFLPRTNESTQNRRCCLNAIARGTLSPRSTPPSRRSMICATSSPIQTRRQAHKPAWTPFSTRSLSSGLPPLASIPPEPRKSSSTTSASSSRATLASSRSSARPLSA